MKHVPNALSISRIVLSFLLPIPFVAHTPWLYIPLYAVIGITDILDGRIARRYKVESDLGAKLDVVSDIVFFVAIVASLLVPPLLQIELVKSAITIGVAMACKVCVIFITRARFKIWTGMMHTYLDKTVGFLQFFAPPIFILGGKIHYAVVLAIAVGLSVSAVEESIILLTSKTYNPNHKGLLFEKKGAREESHA